MAKSDLFGSMKDAGIFFGREKKNRGTFLGSEKRTKEFFLDMLKKLVIFWVHRRNPTAVRHRCAQRYDSENENSVVTAVVETVLR